jgi:hypothetical protein
MRRVHTIYFYIMTKRVSTSIYSRRTQPRLVSVISPVPESSITFSHTDTSTTPSVSAVDQAHPQNLFPSSFLSPILPFHEDASLYSIKHLLWLREHDKKFLDERMDFSRLDDQSIKKNPSLQ